MRGDGGGARGEERPSERPWTRRRGLLSRDQMVIKGGIADRQDLQVLGSSARTCCIV